MIISMMKIFIRNYDRLKLTFCTKIEKMTILMLKVLIQRNFWSCKTLSPNTHNKDNSNK